jgi:serine/threonine protein kinase
MKNILHPDPYLNKIIDGYVLTERIGNGKIGFVYKAVRSQYDVFACKVISVDRLKAGWETELEKVHLLQQVPNVIEYKRHGTEIDNNSKPFLFIFLNYVDGQNLEDYIKTTRPTLPFVIELANVILRVLYACQKVKIFHGDLHAGNILISKPDDRLLDNKSNYYITDFGFGGSKNTKEPKDDVRQFNSIITNLLNQIRPQDLTPEQKILHEKIRLFLAKRFLETDPTQGKFVGNLKLIIEDFLRLPIEAENEASKAKGGVEYTAPGDYLVAEALGYKKEEWKNLFVPEFLGANELLSRNISVLTGARGCGKTMTFRRLTAYMDEIIGESSGVHGADQFIGFYLNCRSIIEAFPYVPSKIPNGLGAQIVHFFHLTWLAEMCRTFSVYKIDQVTGYDWLETYIIQIFGEYYKPLPKGVNVLANIRAFIEEEKERTRIADPGKDNSPRKWSLSIRDFLDQLTVRAKQNLSWAYDKPFYFFLDDYTIPTIPRSLQLILNSIIFKRRDNIFFKISTESAFSFERFLERNKPLEIHQDFELIDLASESLHQDMKTKTKLLENIFNKRIERDEELKGKNITLSSLLGSMQFNNNALAREFRDNPKGRKIYSGLEAFVGLWSSDIRIMIQIFVDMLKETEFSESSKYIIPIHIQNKVYRSAGSEFLDFTQNVPNPHYLEKQQSKNSAIAFGTHLKNIVEAFINVSRWELTEGQLVSNQGNRNPKQAFRLEILDHFQLDRTANEYFEGLIRWHIFLQDRRGKSVRGMLTPRLFMNRVMIPYAQLTFSTKEHIHVNNKELHMLLKDPLNFFNYWKSKKVTVTNQTKLL